MTALLAIAVGLVSVAVLTRRTWDKTESLPPRTTTAFEPRTKSKGGNLP